MFEGLILLRHHALVTGRYLDLPSAALGCRGRSPCSETPVVPCQALNWALNDVFRGSLATRSASFDSPFEC